VIQMSVFSREYLDQFRLCHFIHQPGCKFPFQSLSDEQAIIPCQTGD
jgi:hypothetical protein